MIRSNFSLLSAGLSIAGFLSAFANNAPALAQSNVTFDKVVEYVQLEVNEAKIVQLVNSSPTNFVLGADQVRQLKQAGASDSLISSLQSKQSAVQPGNDVLDFVLILDCSGSMNDRLVDGSSKWMAARKAAIDFVQAVPSGRKLAFIAYGLDAQRQCDAVDLLRPLEPIDDSSKHQLCSKIESLAAVGHTPITRSLNLAGRQLSSSSAMSSIVLITDGMETCHADPVAEASSLVGKFAHLSLKINVIGFCMGDRESAQVERIAQAGNGKFFSAKDSAELLTSVRKVEGLSNNSIDVDEVLPTPLTQLESLLVEQLNDAEMSVRESAAQTIKSRKMTRLAPALVNMIAKVPYGSGIWGDSDRISAIDALMTLSSESAPRAIERALASKQYKVRVWAAEALSKHKIVGAIPSAEKRMLSMRGDDISMTAINGTDEADRLFDAVRSVAPERLQPVIVAMMRSKEDTVRTWATQKLAQVD